MAELFKGKPVVESLNNRLIKEVSELKSKGVMPTLAILRVSNRPDDIAYENAAKKRADQIGVGIKNVVLPTDVPVDKFYKEVQLLNYDDTVHGILMFRPLPAHIDEGRAMRMIKPIKDVDGCTEGSLSGVFTNADIGYAPCTAQAVVEMLDHYGVEISGKNVVVLGRSIVVGRPLAMMFTYRDATVTICHTRTNNITGIARKADILVSCMGKAQLVNKGYFSEGQIVIDVGTSIDPNTGKLVGDVVAEDADSLVKAYSPVPGGVGMITTSILLEHVVRAAKRMSE